MILMAQITPRRAICRPISLREAKFCSVVAVSLLGMSLLGVRLSDWSSYYKREDVNKEAFTEDGWLKTGDIGQVCEACSTWCAADIGKVER